MDKEMNKEERVKEAVEEAKRAAKELGEENPEVAEEEKVQADSDVKSTEDNEETLESKEESKGFFKKKNKKDKKDEKIEELTDKLTRQMAEFDNFRKRTEKEKSQMYEIGAKDILVKMLPVVDNFERGLLGVPQEQKDDAFVQGMDKIYKQILATFEEIGVKPIEAVGAEFNPDLHNAVMHVEDEEYGENIVVEEFQKGYTYHDAVVRHSMVKVAN